MCTGGGAICGMTGGSSGPDREDLFQRSRTGILSSSRCPDILMTDMIQPLGDCIGIRHWNILSIALCLDAVHARHIQYSSDGSQAMCPPSLKSGGSDESVLMECKSLLPLAADDPYASCAPPKAT